MNIRTEVWLGNEIRFVEYKPGKWDGVAVDICKALDIKSARRAMSGLRSDGVHTMNVIDRLGREQTVNTIDARNIYLLVFKSRKKEAVRFQDWVFDIIETLRNSEGLEGFQIFRMLDKEHQREAMNRLKSNLTNPIKVDYIKANSIANKAVSTMYGYPKMIKKGEMTPEMLVPRQEILDETVNLMGVNSKFNLGISISETVQGKYLN
ncbi:BRO family protein [Desulfosporosinus sp.]|uniref:BRO-N domain-containing protein n=1 Tax=Desulfosporosinus sp. TaxID=157907 RepID=UPI0026121521|nr:BRO family protein [Desulfosporosinus sp.]